MKGTGYRVSFSKNIISSDGHPYKCLQDVIVVTANTQDEALEMAKKQFQDRRSIHNWQHHADEVEAIEYQETTDKPVALLR